jgi:predicted RNase H-like nuclease (RuvC/YqgF family)
MNFENLTDEELSRIGESYITTPLERVLMDRFDALLDVAEEVEGLEVYNEELEARIEDLEARIEELEKESSELASNLADCEAEIDNN